MLHNIVGMLHPESELKRGGAQTTDCHPWSSAVWTRMLGNAWMEEGEPYGIPATYRYLLRRRSVPAFARLGPGCASVSPDPFCLFWTGRVLWAGWRAHFARWPGIHHLSWGGKPICGRRGKSLALWLGGLFGSKRRPDNARCRPFPRLAGVLHCARGAHARHIGGNLRGCCVHARGRVERWEA
mgnify:CR=1 FL=1